MRQPANSSPTLRRHRAQCHICRRADRKEIDRQFLDWTSPREIAASLQLGSYRAVYRHAHALSLFEARRAGLRLALDRLIEHVSEVVPTASVVLAAIRLAHQMDQKRQERAETNARAGSSPFLLSFAGLPRTDAVSGHPSKIESHAAGSPSPAPAPVPPPPPARPVPKPAPAPAPAASDTGKSPKVRGFARPWSRRKKPFPSPALEWGPQPPGP